MRNEDGTPLTPYQVDLIKERKLRLARIAAKAVPDPQSMPAKVKEPIESAAGPAAASADYVPAASRSRHPNFMTGKELDEQCIWARIIQRLVCEFYAISIEEMLSSRRQARVVEPRHVGMYLARCCTKLSMPKIGQVFGDKDHATVNAAIRKMTWRIKNDEIFATSVARLKADAESRLKADAGN